jgi:hypothetical protein
MPVHCVHKLVVHENHYESIIPNSIQINLVRNPGYHALSNVSRVPYVVYHDQPMRGSEYWIQPYQVDHHRICC